MKNEAYDYLITEHGIEPLKAQESLLWCLLRENNNRLDYDKAILEIYKIKPKTAQQKIRFLKAISVTQNRLNKRLDGVIVRRMTKYFEYLSKDKLMKMVEEERLWKKSHKSSKD